MYCCFFSSDVEAEFTIYLKDVTAKEGTVAVFECELTIDIDKDDVRWFLNDVELSQDQKFEFLADGASQKLVIKDVAVTDAGKVTVQIGDRMSTANFIVEEIPAEFTIPLKDMTVVEKSTVEFEIELSKDVPPGEVHWFAADFELQPDARIQMISDGKKHKLIINDVTLDDASTITVKVGDQTTSAELAVEKLPAEFILGLTDVSAMENTVAEFVCELSEDLDSVQWFVGDEEVVPGDKYDIISDGPVHKLLIKDVSVLDEGPVTVRVDDATTTASLFVQGEFSWLSYSVDLLIFANTGFICLLKVFFKELNYS